MKQFLVECHQRLINEVHLETSMNSDKNEIFFNEV